MQQVIDISIEALHQIIEPRFHTTERGMASEFHCKIHDLNIISLFPKGTIIEMEAQKSEGKNHGTRQRPDIIIHIPIEKGIVESANQGNYCVFAFKLKANAQRAKEDFDKLDEMFESLDYPIGIFINVEGYPNIYLEQYDGDYRNRVHELSIVLDNGVVKIRHAWFNENGVIQTEER